MASRNVEALARVYGGWETGDFTSALGVLEPSATLVIHPDIPDGGVFVGRDGFRTYMRRFLEAWDSLTIAAKSFREVGDTVLVEVEQAGIGIDSRVPVELHYFQLWTFRGAWVIRLDSILREEAALEAVGLSE